MEKIVVITGGSSGIGQWTARAMRPMGCRVYELSRREMVHPDGIIHLTADVTEEAAVAAAINQVLAQEGHIDVLICNAGFGISGAAEFTEEAEEKHQLDVNLFGAVRAAKAVIPSMRSRGCGRIVFISSVAGVISIPFQAWYSVSKAAIISYSTALREELRPFGISVCAVLPGDIRTGFTAAREKKNAGDELYEGRISRSVAVMEQDEQQGIAPEKAAQRIAQIALKKRVKPSYVLGTKYQFFVLLTRILPASAVSWLVGKIYAS